MRDVASQAEVSVQTVSNVINGRSGHVTTATEARVREVIDRLGFRPNPVARGLRSARLETLAFILLDPASRFLADPMTDLFLAGLGDELRDRDNGLLIRSDTPGARLEDILEPVIEGRVDGAILCLSGEPSLRARYIEQLETFEQPFLLLQEHLSGDTVSSVSAEDRFGARELCRHLIGRGHERIGFVTAAQSWSAIEERIEGYREAQAEAGLEPDDSLVRRAGDFKALDAAVCAGDLLELHPRVTAVMCGNDLIALGVIKAARERGLRVPEDVAVTGFDDFEFAAAMDPALTTVRIPGYEMGRHAAAALLDAVGGSARPESRMFGTDVLLRGSA
jgi:DNA-binding LacI/PurR family transcriptional regulator